MNTNSNSYVMVFAVTVCVVVSSVLAVLATVLKPAQDAAKEFDRRKNVMMAAGLIQPGDTRERDVLQKLWDERIDEFIVDTRTGKKADGGSKDLAKDLKDLNAKAAAEKPSDSRAYRVVATAKAEDGKVASYILPVSGKGLWSTIKGYIALEADKVHVKGITFYEHGETPGLGGEVENKQWTASWQGKQIRDQKGELVSVTVKKGKVDPSIPAEKNHYVDGLSGATITSKGVSTFVKKDLTTFATYLEKN